MADVILSGVSKSFGAIRALSDLSITVPDGSFVVLLGPTGAGKTTTLRMVAGLDSPDHGSVMIGGVSMEGFTPAQRNVAMVFQQFGLLPWRNVTDNVALGLELGGQDSSKFCVRRGV